MDQLPQEVGAVTSHAGSGAVGAVGNDHRSTAVPDHSSDAVLRLVKLGRHRLAAHPVHYGLLQQAGPSTSSSSSATSAPCRANSSPSNGLPSQAVQLIVVVNQRLVFPDSGSPGHA